MIDNFELDLKGEFAEMGRRSKIKMVRQDNIVISECKLHLYFVYRKDVS